MARPSGSDTKFKSFPAFRSPNLNSTRNGRLRPHQARPPPPFNHFHAWRMRTHDSHGGSSDLGCTSSTSDSRRRAAIRRSEACFRGRYVPNRHEMSGRDRIERDAPHPLLSFREHARARPARRQLRFRSREQHIWFVRLVLIRELISRGFGGRGSHPRNTRPTHHPIAMKSHHTAQTCVRTREL